MKTKYHFFLLATLLLATACNNDDSGEEFPETLQNVWQDEAGSYSNNDFGIYFKKDKMYSWDYIGDSFDSGNDCYVEEEVGELVSYDGNAYRISMKDSPFTGRENVEETIYINNNNTWISAYLESDVNDERIWFKDSRTIGEIDPLCEEL